MQKAVLSESDANLYNKDKMIRYGGEKMKTDLFHSLAGKNLRFRPLDVSDVLEIHSYTSDEEASRYIGWRLMRTPEETLHHIEEMRKREAAGTHLYASIVPDGMNEVIGTAMIFNIDPEARHAEIGYVLHPKYWGKGYGTEAISLMDDFAFDTLKLHKLHAQVVEANTGSIRVLEKNGFHLEGRLEDYYFIDNRYHDGLLYGRINPKETGKTSLERGTDEKDRIR